MTTTVIDTDQITHVPGATAFTLSEADSIWIFQEGVRVVADNLNGGTGIGGGGFSGNLVDIEGSVDAETFLLTNFGSNNEIHVTETGRLGETIAGLINLRDGKDNQLRNDGSIRATQIFLGEDGVVFNNGTMTILGANMTGYGDTGAELLSNNGTFNGGVTNFRTIINDGAISGGIVGAFVDTTVVNSGTIGFGIQFRDGDDTYDGSGGGRVNGVVKGDQGDDTMTGGQFDDKFEGNLGNDLLIGKGGNDTLSGGGGNDDVSGLNGNDVLSGDGGEDQLSGGAGNDSIDGGEGDDSISGNLGNDTITGGIGDDVLLGNDGADSISGDAGDDRINGGDDDDQLFGRSGNDNILGGTGDDTIYGGSGNDTMAGEQGFDLLTGGNGADLYDFRVGSDVDFIFGFQDDLDTISLSTFDFDSVQEALSFATEVGGGVQFDFDTGDQLFVQDATIAALQDDIII